METIKPQDKTRLSIADEDYLDFSMQACYARSIIRVVANSLETNHDAQSALLGAVQILQQADETLDSALKNKVPSC